MTKWEIPEITDDPPFIVDSTQFYDDKKYPYASARDRKNMRIRGESITNSNSGGGGGGNAEYKIKIDPDETNQLEDRKKGLYVPPVTWEKLT